MSKKRNLANEIKEGFDALARIRELEAEVGNWRDNYLLLANTINPTEDMPALDAAKLLITRCEDFKSYIDMTKEEAGIGDKDLIEWIRRIRGRCDTFDWERQAASAEADKWHKEYLNASKDAMTFAGQLEKALEDAWQRVSYGKVDFTAEDFKNSMMFDFPRYDWSELRDLIKGVKR